MFGITLTPRAAEGVIVMGVVVPGRVVVHGRRGSFNDRIGSARWGIIEA